MEPAIEEASLLLLLNGPSLLVLRGSRLPGGSESLKRVELSDVGVLDKVRECKELLETMKSILLTAISGSCLLLTDDFKDLFGSLLVESVMVVVVEDVGEESLSLLVIEVAV